MGLLQCSSNQHILSSNINKKVVKKLSEERLTLHICPDEGPRKITISTRGLWSYIDPNRIDLGKDQCLKQYDEAAYNSFILITEKYPYEMWGKMQSRELLHILHRNDLDPRIKVYIKDNADIILESFRKQIVGEGILETVIYNIQDINQQLPPPDIDPYDIDLIPNSRVLQEIPGARLEPDQENPDINWLIFQFNGHGVRIPIMPRILHKGGTARLIAKMLFLNNPEDTDQKDLILSEIPIKDWDIIAYDSEQGIKFMHAVGEKDSSGIESFDGNLSVIMYSRDIDLNQCLFGTRGLYYTNGCQEAIRTGTTKSCVGDHGIYGIDYFIIHNHRMPKGRVTERCIKPVIENKIKRFQYLLEWLQICTGISPLIGSMRKIDKPGFPERLAKFYYMLEITGQIDQFRYIFAHKFGVLCKDIFDFYTNLHRMYPFVLFEKFGSLLGVSKWLISRLLKYHRYRFKQQFGLGNLDLSWIELDPNNEILHFSDDGYQRNPELIEAITQKLPVFLEECKLRNQEEAKRQQEMKASDRNLWIPMYLKRNPLALEESICN